MTPMTDLHILELEYDRAKQRLEVAKAAFEHHRLKVVEAALDEWRMPMYERDYCEPADQNLHLRSRTGGVQTYIGSLGSSEHRDAPTEPPHHATELYEQSLSDVGLAVWVETGRHLRVEFKIERTRDWVHHLTLDPRPQSSDDRALRWRLEPDDYISDEWHGLDRRIDATRWNEESLYYTQLQTRLSDISVDRIHLAMEYGFDVDDQMNYRISDDDPRELTCDDRGHLEAHDRWTRAEW